MLPCLYVLRQVCAGQQFNDLKIRKLSGDNVEYTNLCKELLAGKRRMSFSFSLQIEKRFQTGL